MSAVCPGLAIAQPAPSSVCPGQYHCLDTRTTPAGESCVSPKYVFAPHYIRHGFLAPGASGAYVPACTVCFSHLAPVPVSRLKRGDTLAEIPPAQVPPV
jgi:hypothetical protein